MQYLKVQRTFRTSPAWVRASNAARGIWMAIAGYCADNETSGRIVGGKTLGRGWSQCDGVTADDAHLLVMENLARWEGEDLVIDGYDLTGEQAYQRTRDQAAGAGRASATARSSGRLKPAVQPHGSTARLERTVEPQPQPDGSSDSFNQPLQPSGSTDGFNPTVQPILHSPSSIDQSGGSPSPVNPAREEPPPAAAAALPADRWTPEKAQQLASLLGGRDSLAGQPLAAEWRNAFAGQTPEQVQATWLAAGEPITLPSHYHEHRKDIETQLESDRAATQRREEAKERRQRVERDQSEAAAAKERRQAAASGDRAKAASLLALIDAEPTRWIPTLDHGTKLRVDRLRTLVAEEKAPQLILAQVLASVPAELREAVAAAVVP